MKKKNQKENNLFFYGELTAIVIALIIAVKVILPQPVQADSTAPTIEQETVTETASKSAAAQETTVEPAAEPESEQPSAVGTVSGNTVDDGELNIVVFGDSIWDEARYQDGVAEQLASMTGAKVYNCAMGGTSAALISESTQVETWDSRSLNGLTYVATGRADAYTQLEGYDAKDIIESIDFNKVDYFIFSYGLNDYFSSVKVMPEDLLDMTTYVGALRHGIQIMRQTFPQARYMIIAPTYCQFLSNGQVVSDSNSKDYGEGTLEAYVDGAALVAREYKTMYLDAYHDFGINAETAATYLADGVHLTAEGRTLYAKQVADAIMSLGN